MFSTLKQLLEPALSTTSTSSPVFLFASKSMKSDQQLNACPEPHLLPVGVSVTCGLVPPAVGLSVTSGSPVGQLLESGACTLLPMTPAG